MLEKIYQRERNQATQANDSMLRSYKMRTKTWPLVLANSRPCEEQFSWDGREESLIPVDFRENKKQKLEFLSRKFFL